MIISTKDVPSTYSECHSGERLGSFPSLTMRSANWSGMDLTLEKSNFRMSLGLFLHREIVLHGFHTWDLPSRPGRLGTGRHVRHLTGQRDDPRIGMNIDIGVLETRVLHLGRRSEEHTSELQSRVDIS